MREGATKMFSGSLLVVTQICGQTPNHSTVPCTPMKCMVNYLSKAVVKRNPDTERPKLVLLKVCLSFHKSPVNLKKKTLKM